LEFTLGALLVAISVSVQAQALKVPQIGFLALRTEINKRGVETFNQKLQELGYVNGNNIDIVYRWTEGGYDRLPSLAPDLVHSNVEVIVTSGTAATLAAKNVTKTIPIVMTSASDPVASKLVASLAEPGGNITGSSFFAPELSGKRLELLREAFPKIGHVAVLWNMGASPAFRETQAAANISRLNILSLQVQRPEDFDRVFELATKEHVDSLIVIPGAIMGANQKRIIDFAAKSRLPAIYQERGFAENGGLMSYGPDFMDFFRRAAVFLDKILKGAKPADLPVEQPTKFELVINLQAAKQIGLTIPPNVLARADKVIK
jgi:putative ABC transport system substrate-binding protein